MRPKLKTRTSRRIYAATFALMLAKAAEGAGLPRPFNPHSLRHACGYKMASDGTSMRVIQHYLGHRDLKSTEIYTEAAPVNFKNLFRV